MPSQTLGHGHLWHQLNTYIDVNDIFSLDKYISKIHKIKYKLNNCKNKKESKYKGSQEVGKNLTERLINLRNANIYSQSCLLQTDLESVL